MDLNFLLPLLVLGTSLLTGAGIFLLGDDRMAVRSALNMGGATLKIVLVAVTVWGTYSGEIYETRWTFMPGLDFVLRVDPISLIFAVLSAVLWFVTTLYAIGYLEGSPNRSRFFGFFSLCVTATMGIALAGNLMTFFIFYEMLTLATYPMVVHRGTPDSIAGGKKYLGYTLTGGVVLLIGVVWLHAIAGPVEFTTGGVLASLAASRPEELTLIFALLIGGLGVKAALVPLHGWLPAAMVAPAPVSALLHAVAVVKAGAYGIVRVIYDVYGLRVAYDLGLLAPLMIVASVTIVYGSLRALQQTELKKRLAFSTVSQLSYIMLGTAIFGPQATIGGLVHLIHQGIMKITLFFCVGNLSETLGVHSVNQMSGVGRRMPLTMAAFTLAALGMIGVPPMAGFISKWYIGLGSLEAGEGWVIGVLVASSILNSMYFLPVVYAAWFRQQEQPWEEHHPRGRLEASWMLVLPPVVTAVGALAAGVLAGVPFSPLDMTRLIAASLYQP
jgi:multicomponent Na+:H+ antiporter subunit D